MDQENSVTEKIPPPSTDWPVSSEKTPPPASDWPSRSEKTPPPSTGWRMSDEKTPPSPAGDSVGHAPYSLHQSSESFPPEPGCDLSNPYYDLAVPSSSSSYTMDSHSELLKVKH